MVMLNMILATGRAKTRTIVHAAVAAETAANVRSSALGEASAIKRLIVC